MTEKYNEQFYDVFMYAKAKIFNNNPQFSEAIASKLYRHGYIYCNEVEVLDYIKGMLNLSKIPFVVSEIPGIRWTDYKVEIV